MTKRPHLHVLLYEALTAIRHPGESASKKEIIRQAQQRCRDNDWSEPNGDNLSVRLREMAREGSIAKVKEAPDGKPLGHIEYTALRHPDALTVPAPAIAQEAKTFGQTTLL